MPAGGAYVYSIVMGKKFGLVCFFLFVPTRHNLQIEMNIMFILYGYDYRT